MVCRLTGAIRLHGGLVLLNRLITESPGLCKSILDDKQ